VIGGVLLWLWRPRAQAGGPQAAPEGAAAEAPAGEGES